MHVPARWVAFLLPLATVLVCALIWVAAVQTTKIHRGNLMSDAARENGNRAIAYAHFIAGVFDRADSAARHLARVHGGAAATGDGRPRALIDSAAAEPLFARIDIADALGRVVLSSAESRTARSIADMPAFYRLRAGAGDAPVISDPASDALSGVPAIGFARPIRGADGGFAGAVVLTLPVDRLTDFYQGADFRPHDLISVIRLDGLTLARREGSTVSYGQYLAGKLVMRQQLVQPNGTYIGPSAVDGITRIFSHRRLARYGIFVTVGLGTDDVLALSYARARIFYTTVGALTLTLLGGALAFWLGLRRREAIIQRLAATNARLCEAQAIGKMGDWELDLTTGMLVCSDEICRMHGRPPSEDVLRGEEALAYHDPASRKEIERTLRTAIASKRPEQCEVTATMGDGRVAQLRIRMSPIVDGDGRVRTVLGTEQDITTERRHEQLRAEVAHITRVEAVNVMAATIAHELSQPLTAAGNYLTAASHLAGQAKLSLLDQERLAVLLGQANRQIGLAGKIISRAREMVSDRGASEVASLEDIVGEAIALSKVAVPAAARARITVQLQPDTGHVAADKVQIQQVLLNLIRNAAQALEGAKDPQILVSSRRERAGMVEVSVADNGRGLPAGVDDIFAPFGASGRDGLGIGLSICRTIVDSYGGRIWNDSSALGGAAICFTLPLDELALLYDVA
ncbi:PAS domain S-box-containing protein [Sphingomonas naasensis]|uniref:histidine kinase n=1 Tax=Sphingomonas naasensis TaxID=1344951 RepID=A0A4S1WQ55_9SPHN|nr:ATP-binding protein [Sphingomonas naasensis]NIJ21029.1 PAS domain S-box-containing protein [Sphingomonas naasensis]TGX43406.1 PAS domain-containing protein [Sphingomonas naasensis]